MIASLYEKQVPFLPGVAWRNDALSGFVADLSSTARCMVGFLGHPEWLWVVYEVCDADDGAMWTRAVAF
jgi:hypothetical protein